MEQQVAGDDDDGDHGKPSAGQALQAAIGAANLAAWIDGTANVGHAALSN